LKFVSAAPEERKQDRLLEISCSILGIEQSCEAGRSLWMIERIGDKGIKIGAIREILIL
jgi:hypothetical protein